MTKRTLDLSSIDVALESCRAGSLSGAELMEELGRIHQKLTGMRSANAQERKNTWTLLVHGIYTKHKRSMSCLAAAVGCSVGYLSRKFTENGYEARSCAYRSPGYAYKRQFTVDDSVFATITARVAYWLGFLYADGRVLVKKGRQVGEGLKVVLAPRDREHLEELRGFLKSDSPIMLCTSRIADTVYDGVALSIYSKRLAKRLMELGVVPGRATRNTDLPPIPEENAAHFLRGLWDGDGYIKRDRRVGFVLSGWEFGICGNLKTIEYVENFGRSRGITPNRRIRNGRSQVNWRVAFTGPAAIEMMKAVYGVEGPFLNRKGETAQTLITLEKKFAEQGVAAVTVRGKSRYVGIAKLKKMDR